MNVQERKRVQDHITNKVVLLKCVNDYKMPTRTNLIKRL